MFANLSRRVNFTLLEPFYFLFLMTALMGVWSSYDRARSAILFFLIVGGYLLYRMSSTQTIDHTRNLISLLGLFSIGLVAYFLLSNDWSLIPADFGFIERIGNRWMDLRPNLSLPSIHPNIFAGVLASITPLLIANSIYYRSRPWSVQGILSLLGVAVSGIGLFMSSSRAAWLALIVGLLVWTGLHWLQKAPKSYRYVSWGVFIVAAVVLLYMVGGGVVFFTQTPAISNGSLGSRLALARGAWELAKDVFWTGGGLGSFAGLYSNYILLIPVPMFFYSHNLYLDVLIEQGVFGLVALLGLVFGSLGIILYSFWRKNRENSMATSLTLPILAGLLVIVLHSMIDNPYYEAWSRPMLGLLPGMCIAITGYRYFKLPSLPLLNLAAVGFAAIVLAWYFNPLVASWQANFGAVEMARRQLKNWPTGEWRTADMAQTLAPAKEWLGRAFDFDTTNRTSNYRLGLIALQEEDFKSAVTYLDEAERISPNHRGIKKALGYALTWTGENQRSIRLLAEIPESQDEMEVYSWWWGVHGRPELAQRAEEMLLNLSRNGW